MAKFSRNQLKSLVKECLVEILEEGIRPTSEGIVSEGISRTSMMNKSQRAPEPRRKALDNISYGNKKSKKVKNQKFNENINRSVTALSSDPVLQAIFSDTAKTTLQEQISDSGPSAEVQISSQGDSAAREMIESDPMNIFGDASGNWEALAFSNSQLKN